MFRCKAIIRQISAALLVLIFFSFWSFKTGHAFFLHRHSDHPVCSAAYDAKGLHIHDERFALDECSLCAFVVSVPEPFTLPLFELQGGKGEISFQPNFYCSPAIAYQQRGASMHRGPPVNGMHV